MRLASLALIFCALLPSVPALAQAGPDWQSRGAELSKGRYRPIEGIVAHAERWNGKRVRVEGQVLSVCKVKGCWMELSAGDETVRVRFKDYGFFVPKDCEGSLARIEGQFLVRVVPVEEARHYLEDAGKHEEAAALTEPVPTFELIADGVALRQRP